MKRFIALNLAAISVFSLIAIFILGNDAYTEKEITDSDTVTIGYKYTVKEFNGKIAVFNYGAARPLEILECPLSSLPSTEKTLLSEGINVENDIQLQKLIEAYD